MKTVCFGDIHGLSIWENILDKENPDKVIFLGDYFDPYNADLNLTMYENFEAILALKDKMNDKCILLIGNHDFHYITNLDQSSRWSYVTHKRISKTLRDLYVKKDLVFAHQQGKYLFTHAGVNKFWLRERAKLNPEDFTAEQINNLPLQLFGFDSISRDVYGDDPLQSPIWVRPKTLLQNQIEGFIQVVGHTRTPMAIAPNYPNVIFMDRLALGQYLVIGDDDEYKIVGYDEE